MKDSKIQLERASRQPRQRGPLNKIISHRMRVLGLRNVAEFGEYAGLSEAVVYTLLNGRMSNGKTIKPQLETLEKLSVALDAALHELVYLVSPEARGAVEVLGSEMLPVHIAGHVGAGPEQLRESGDDVVYVEKHFAQKRDLVAFRVLGNSMAGGKQPIQHGDVVIIDRKLDGEVNAPVVARLHNDGHVVKRLRSGDYLDSTNPDYDQDDAVIPPTQVAQVLGRVVRIMADLV